MSDLYIVREIWGDVGMTVYCRNLRDAFEYMSDIPEDMVRVIDAVPFNKYSWGRNICMYDHGGVISSIIPTAEDLKKIEDVAYIRKSCSWQKDVIEELGFAMASLDVCTEELLQYIQTVKEYYREERVEIIPDIHDDNMLRISPVLSSEEKYQKYYASMDAFNDEYFEVFKLPESKGIFICPERGEF